MYDISSATIEHKVLHRIGNKFREEPLVLSDNLMPSEEEINNLLLINYLKPLINLKEPFELFHESNIELNEVYHFSNKIFNDNLNFLSTSKDIAKSLYSHSTHPNILLGELIVILYRNIIVNNKKIQGLGIYKTELKDNYLDVQEEGKTLVLMNKQGISINKIQKGALVLEDGNVFAIDALNQKTKYWYNDFLKIKLKKTPENNAQILKKVIQKVVSNIENPIEKLKINNEISQKIEKTETITFSDLKDISEKYIENETFNEITTTISSKENITLEDVDIVQAEFLDKLTKNFRKKLNINNLLDLTLKSNNHVIGDITTHELNNEVVINIKILNK
ncbi:hypothetical protein A1Z17_RS05835 [Acinetobacter baumannii]|nr:hypothetical protein [Acinetobacter baumannii]